MTSFNKDLYEATGKRLIKSFFQHEIQGELLVGYEDFDLSFANNKIHTWDLGTVDLLRKFLGINIDIIPHYLGGNAIPCTCCKKPFAKKDSEHVKGCYFTWWNRNCSRWFRKFVCLNLAFDYEVDYVIWIDSDCMFRKYLPALYIDALFNNNDYFYMKGKKRAVDETGIFGIRRNDMGRKFLWRIINKYLNKEFRSCIRWDDSYQTMKARKDKNLNITSIDICKNLNVSNVADHSPLSKYIVHRKGTHGRVLGIMK